VVAVRLGAPVASRFVLSGCGALAPFCCLGREVDERITTYDDHDEWQRVVLLRLQGIWRQSPG
jgi:hypothetical protein